MAGNNYFGFTHGGTQYGAQPATAYAQQPAQPTYVQQAQPTAYASTAPQRAQTYETAYQAAPAAAATQYTYTARTQVAAPTYDPNKAYYTPAAAAPAAPTAQSVYSVAETQYQPGSYQAPAAVPVVAAKPAYSTPTYSAPQTIRQNTVIKPQQTAAPNNSYYTSSNTTPVSTSSSRFGQNVNVVELTGYDAALYSAASSYISQQSKVTPNTWQKKPTFQKTTFTKTFSKPKPQPKQQQLHYCEVCKISCAGPQTYREHLDGQKHKKKEAALKTGTAANTGRPPQNQLRCELCDVTCTGSDAYAAHIRGAKHQKVLKLHMKLGKPIPSTQPTVVASSSSTTSSSSLSTASTKSITALVSKPSVKSATATAPPAVKKVLATPKITFVGAGNLKTTGHKVIEAPKPEIKEEPKLSGLTAEDKEDTTLLPGEKEVTPVGHEYIEEVKNEFGKVVSFHCKLCECKFNDPNAKLMHMKGRRHRLQYKKKVDPSLLVEVKPSIRQRKVQEEKMRRQSAKEEYWRRRDAEERWREEMRYMMMYEQPSYGYGYGGRGMPVRRPESLDDRHVMGKHTSIYPNETELLAVQSIVSSVEKALKLVSDQIAEVDAPMDTDKKKDAKPEPVVVKKEIKEVVVKKEADTKETKDKEDEEKKDEDKKEEKDESPAAPRVLKGVMRVGVLAKGLLLHGDLNVHLVVLCAEKPTRTLLERISSLLPKQLATVTEDKYEVKMCVEEAAAIVTAEKEPKTTCAITLTSPVMRDENADGEPLAVVDTKPDPPDVLDRQKCLDALAALRHAKWFQARANGLQSCVVVIRIMRDLCQRVPTWTPLNQWAMELLVEKCVSSGGSNMSPGDALRRVFESISSGLLLPGGPGLMDPCEKDPTDASIGLSNQEREDISASAQHALRLIAFRQIHKVLGMDALPKFQKRFNPRKRKATGGSESGDAEAEGKKDKKEEEEKK